MKPYRFVRRDDEKVVEGLKTLGASVIAYLPSKDPSVNFINLLHFL